MGTKALNLSDVRKNLPTLVDEVASTKQSVIITRHGAPVAQLTPYVAEAVPTAYALREVPITVAEDFDEPLPIDWDAIL